MSDTADHLEREIETHRANVEDTLDKLRGRLSADQLVDDIGQFVGLEDVRSTLATAGRQVRENPLALGLIGIGVAWLLMGRSQTDPGPADRHREQGDTPSSGAGPAPGRQGDMDARGAEPAADAVRDTPAARACGMRDRASGIACDLADKAGHAASGLTGDVRHLAADVADRMHARDLLTPISHRLNRQPLFWGGIALVAGAVIGAALPRTRTEDRLLGAPRTRLMQESRETARGLKDRAAEAAPQTGKAAEKATGAHDPALKGETTIAAGGGNGAAAAAGEVRDQIAPEPQGTGDGPAESTGTGPRPNRVVRNRT
ncbi:MAG: hypothetical protein RLZZ413_2738 [Pseudomonadota bacterium]